MRQSNRDVVLRDADRGELADLGALALRSKAHWGYSPALLEAMRDELSWSPADLRHIRFRVAEHEGTVVGFAAVAPLEDDRAELEAMFVEPASIGLGIGRRLMQDAVAAARDLGCHELLIQADPHAEAFYRRAGAVRIGTRPSGSIAGRELPLMTLSIVR